MTGFRRSKKGLRVLSCSALALISVGFGRPLIWAQAGPAAGGAGFSRQWSPQTMRRFFGSLDTAHYAGRAVRQVDIQNLLRHLKNLDFDIPSHQNAAAPLFERLEAKRIGSWEDYSLRRLEGKEDPLIDAIEAAVESSQARARILTDAVAQGGISLKNLDSVSEQLDGLTDRAVYLPVDLQEKVRRSRSLLRNLRQIPVLGHAERMARLLDQQGGLDSMEGAASAKTSLSEVLNSRVDEIIAEHPGGGRISPERLEENARDANALLANAGDFIPAEKRDLLAAFSAGFSERLGASRPKVPVSGFRESKASPPAPRIKADRQAGPAWQHLKVAGNKDRVFGLAVLFLALGAAGFKLPLALGAVLLNFVLIESLSLNLTLKQLLRRELEMAKEAFHAPPNPLRSLWHRAEAAAFFVVSILTSAMLTAMSAALVALSYGRFPGVVFGGVAFGLSLVVAWRGHGRLFFALSPREEILKEAWEVWDKARPYLDCDPARGPRARYYAAEAWKRVLIFLDLRGLPASQMGKDWEEMTPPAVEAFLRDYKNYVEADPRLSPRAKSARIEQARRLEQMIRDYLGPARP